MSYDITLIASNACGVDIEQQNISFDPVLPIQLVSPSIICSDKPVTFHIAYAGTGLHDIHWSTGDTTASITTSTLDGDSIHVTALDNNGCPLQSSFLVSHTGMGGLGTAYVPNVFSPNKDGINDYFAAAIPDGFVSMTIFNRWGTRSTRRRISTSHGEEISRDRLCRMVLMYISLNGMTSAPILPQVSLGTSPYYDNARVSLSS